MLGIEEGLVLGHWMQLDVWDWFSVTQGQSISLGYYIRCFLQEEGAKGQLPTADKIAEYQELISANYPAMAGTWCVMDGLKLQSHKSSDEATQDAYYNGWLHDHLVGSVFLFAPSGLIVACSVNAPGSWHDSTVAENGGLISDLKKSS
jgi:hypothetical protein